MTDFTLGVLDHVGAILMFIGLLYLAGYSIQRRNK